MKLNKLIKVLALVGLLGSGVAQAALVDRGGGMIYDTDLNITWLADANYAQTSGYDADGRMTWANAMAWADGLIYGGYSDWRLPTTLQPDGSCLVSFDAGAPYGVQSFGFGCSGSELGHLFYIELGGSAYSNSWINASSDPDWSLLQNIQSFPYWSGTVQAPFPAEGAWAFDRGYQFGGRQEWDYYAWAVRPGDVVAVPEPASALLVGLGLAGLAATRRRRALGAA